jgi:diguanylate cyclase (GGDEF)-like protein
MASPEVTRPARGTADGQGPALALVAQRPEELAVELARLRDRDRQHGLLLEILRLVARSAPSQEVLQLVVDSACELLGGESASLHERLPESPDHLTMVAWAGHVGAWRSDLARVPLDQGLSGQVVREGRAVISHAEDAQRPFLAPVAAGGVTAAIGVPVMRSGEAVAALVVSTRSSELRFCDAERELLSTFAAQVELVLHHASLVAERDEAQLDDLTGLPGRTVLVERLTRALARGARSGDGVAVLFLDLDRFKPINDSLGHDAGDEVLRVVATRLRAVLREVDTPARIGGDEFAVLLEDADAERAELVARRIVVDLAAPVAVGDRHVTIGVSIGVAVATPQDDAERLLHGADLAMYDAKRTLGTAVSHHDPALHEAAVKQLNFDNAVAAALDLGQLSLAFEPIVDLRSGATYAFEALLRWQHPEFGAVPIERLVERAETTGEMLRIGRWMLDEACRFAASWPAEGRPTLSLDVSVTQLATASLAADVLDAIARHGLLATDVVLEVTESGIGALGDVRESLLTLHEAGVSLGIDAFGSGGSVLSQLRALPVMEVKLHRSLLPHFSGDQRAWAAPRALIAMCRELDLQVVAEGVDEDHQRRQLEELGCHAVQGLVEAAPMGFDEAIWWWTSNRPAQR